MWYEKLLEALFAVVEIALWLFLTGNMLTIRRKKSTACFVVAFVFILYMLYSFFNSEDILYKIVLWSTFLLATIYLYSEKILIKVFSWLVFMGILALPEMIILIPTLLFTNIPVDKINDDIPMWAIVVTLARTLSFIIVVFIAKKLKKRQTIEVDKYFSRTLYLMLGVSIVAFFATAALFANYSGIGDNYRTAFLIIGIIFCLELVLCIMLIYKMSQKSKEIIDNNKRIQMLESTVQLNRQIDISESNLRAIRHNISNVFGIVKGLIDTQSYEELNEYMEGIIGDIQDANEIMLLENKALSVLINNKNAIAKSYGIDFKSIISICTIENMSNSDLCSLMGNIWDNAIEATKEVEDIKYIRTTMQVANDEYIVTCENTYKYEPIIYNNIFISRKKHNSTSDKEEHGIGTKNIKAIVEKYGGSITNTFSEGEFNLRIVWPIEKVDDHSVMIKE